MVQLFKYNYLHFAHQMRPQKNAKSFNLDFLYVPQRGAILFAQLLRRYIWRNALFIWVLIEMHIKMTKRAARPFLVRARQVRDDA